MRAIVVEVVIGLCVVAYGSAAVAAVRVVVAALGTKRRIEQLAEHRVFAALPRAREDLERLTAAATRAQALLVRGAAAIAVIRAAAGRTRALRIFR